MPSEISIVEKKYAKPSGTRRFQYAFRLSEAPSPQWIEVLRGEVAHEHDVHGGEASEIEVKGDELALVCIPANLSNRYAALKKAIAGANARIREAEEKSSRAKQERAAYEAARADRERAHEAAAKTAFDNLAI